jgi:UDP-N-acetylglucosamine/UDP-N-acetylgalactosamine 4-epimerase
MNDQTGTIWVVTGAAGFIGSHLTVALLQAGATVRAVDDLSTGKRANFEVATAVGGALEIHEGSIGDAALMDRVTHGADYVLHQAALGSVPRSMADPLATHRANVDGFLTVLDAARRAGVRRLVYASSSSVYGDHPDLPKCEDRIGEPLSPYAASKRINEVYAAAYANAYGFTALGLRYFNVFGPRQDPEGAYAAVIPRWFRALFLGEPVTIYGDGETSRDFCPVANVVQANLKAATAVLPEGAPAQFNIALGGRTTLRELYDQIRARVAEDVPEVAGRNPEFQDFRAGDIRHSLADISQARRCLGYEPTQTLAEGLAEAAPWYRALGENDLGKTPALG